MHEVSKDCGFVFAKPICMYEVFTDSQKISGIVKLAEFFISRLNDRQKKICSIMWSMDCNSPLKHSRQIQKEFLEIVQSFACIVDRCLKASLFPAATDDDVRRWSKIANCHTLDNYCAGSYAFALFCKIVCNDYNYSAIL